MQKFGLKPDLPRTYDTGIEPRDENVPRNRYREEKISPAAFCINFVRLSARWIGVLLSRPESSCFRRLAIFCRSRAIFKVDGIPSFSSQFYKSARRLKESKVVTVLMNAALSPVRASGIACASSISRPSDRGLRYPGREFSGTSPFKATGIHVNIEASDFVHIKACLAHSQ